MDVFEGRTERSDRYNYNNRFSSSSFYYYYYYYSHCEAENTVGRKCHSFFVFPHRRDIHEQINTTLNPRHRLFAAGSGNVLVVVAVLKLFSTPNHTT
ncbi:hypothetical protein E2C01_026357 [Portunus trituberculatus]|uniref:Uncharacterized protein n=1 Tax=Portunus trituberculatus TaxID=210409 RepID=A0A5B7EIM7_PORTR|nr:hypothetical protein [Portunus trituberculatus]